MIAVGRVARELTCCLYSECEVYNEAMRAKNDEVARWLWEESLKWTQERV